MSTPTHLKHKPIVSVDDYQNYDGSYGHTGDAESLSIGIAQYDSSEISAKVFRYSKSAKKWCRESEELPLHRLIDLTTTLLKSILLSAGKKYPKTQFEVQRIPDADLGEIIDYYKDKNNKSVLLPKLKDLQKTLNDFMIQEPTL